MTLLSTRLGEAVNTRRGREPELDQACSWSRFSFCRKRKSWGWGPLPSSGEWEELPPSAFPEGTCNRYQARGGEES